MFECFKCLSASVDDMAEIPASKVKKDQQINANKCLKLDIINLIRQLKINGAVNQRQNIS